MARALGDVPAPFGSVTQTLKVTDPIVAAYLRSEKPDSYIEEISVNGKPTWIFDFGQLQELRELPSIQLTEVPVLLERLGLTIISRESLANLRAGQRGSGTGPGRPKKMRTEDRTPRLRKGTDRYEIFGSLSRERLTDEQIQQKMEEHYADLRGRLTPEIVREWRAKFS